jgi:hypothetical protein
MVGNPVRRVAILEYSRAGRLPGISLNGTLLSIGRAGGAGDQSLFYSQLTGLNLEACVASKVVALGFAGLTGGLTGRALDV